MIIIQCKNPNWLPDNSDKNGLSIFGNEQLPYGKNTDTNYNIVATL